MNADVQLARSHRDKGLKTEMVRIEAICAAFRDEWSSSKHGVGQGMAIPERTLKCISLHMPEKTGTYERISDAIWAALSQIYRYRY